jgi:hypothetical protein
MPRSPAVAEFRRGEVQSGRYGSGDNVQPSGRLGLVEGGLSLIGEEFVSQGLVVVDGSGGSGGVAERAPRSSGMSQRATWRH